MTYKTKPFILIGTSGWVYKGWGSVFYPKEVKIKDRFSYYCQHFDVVEINATYYRLFDKKTFEKWRSIAPRNFKYIIKLPRVITHIKKLYDCENDIKNFCQLVSTLKNKLGLILMQLPPSMPYEPQRLKEALLMFDNPKKVVVEFRNKKWLTEEVKSLLTEVGSIFCITDSPIIKLSDWVTSNIAYIRLHGRTRWYDYNYSEKQLKELAELIKKILSYGAKKIFILFNNDIHAYAPKNALELKEVFEKKPKTNK